MYKDLAIVVGTMAASALLLAWLRFPLPGPVAIGCALAVATWRLHARGLGWRRLGLARPASLPRTAASAVLWMFAAYGGAVAASLLGMLWFGWAQPDVSAYGARGDLPRYLLMLSLAWSSAAFGEELLFRGYLLDRIEAALGATRSATAAAVVLQAAAFGAVHANQGPAGMLTTGAIGLVFGIAYARTRSLWPLILAHGMIDTVSLTALYLGALPAP